MTGKVKMSSLSRSPSPVIPQLDPLSFPRAIGPLFQLRQSDQSDQYQLQNNILQLRLWSDSQLRFHPQRPTIAPRRFDESSSVETQGVAPRYKSLAYSLPLRRSQSEHGRKLAQSCSRTKISPGNPPALPRCRSQIQDRLLLPSLYRPWSGTTPTWPKATVGTIGTP